MEEEDGTILTSGGDPPWYIPGAGAAGGSVGYAPWSEVVLGGGMEP